MMSAALHSEVPHPMLVNEFPNLLHGPLGSVLGDLLRWHRLLNLGDIPAGLRIAFGGFERNTNVEVDPFHFWGVRSERAKTAARFMYF